jgi:3-oxoacyl-[acyl-carrier protein] reductase
MGDYLRERIKKGSADWDRTLAVNLKGPFLCTQAAAQHLEGGGAIVNVADGSADRHAWSSGTMGENAGA